MSKSVEEIIEDWDVRYEEVNLSTLLTVAEKTDFGMSMKSILKMASLTKLCAMSISLR